MDVGRSDAPKVSLIYGAAGREASYGNGTSYGVVRQYPETIFERPLSGEPRLNPPLISPLRSAKATRPYASGSMYLCVAVWNLRRRTAQHATWGMQRERAMARGSE